MSQMMIGSIARNIATLAMLTVLGCGGASQPAQDPTTPAPTKDPSDSPIESKGSDSTSAKSEEKAEKPQESEVRAPVDKANIQEGLQLLDRRSLNLDFALNLMKKGEGKGVQSGSWSFAEERTMRVKAAKKDVISELQVVYGKWDAKPLLGLTYEMPTDGKTYLLASKGGNLTIVRGSNEKLSGDEQASVKAEYGWVGNRNPVRKALLDIELKPGAELPKSAELTQLLLGQIPGCDMAQTDVVATLDKIDGGSRKKATLNLTAKTRIVSNKTSFELELKGSAAVDVETGWVLGADLSGTAVAKGSIKHPKQGEMEVSGKSKVTLVRSSEFR
jgi:hypothetical protein